MKKWSLSVLFILFMALSSFGNTLGVCGFVYNIHHEPVDDVDVSLISGGKVIAHAKTESNGSYIVKAPIKSNVDASKLKVEFFRTGYKTINVELKDLLKGKSAKNGVLYVGEVNEVMHRTITPAFWISLIILIGIFVLISFDVLHRTVAAIVGAALLLFISYTLGIFDRSFFIISFDQAIHAIDFNVIFLLMSMMIVVGVMKKTGVFQWLAYKSYAISKGNVFLLSVILMFVTAIVSAFLDNVTTMLLLAPVSIEIAVMLDIDPFSLLIPEVLASNMGGTATLIGDPPNIMIGSYAHLTFNDFVIELTPVILIIVAVNALVMKFFFNKEYKKGKVENVEALLEKLRQEYKITDPKLLKYCLAILAFVIALFVAHGALHMEPSIAAMIGAALILLFSGVDITDVMEHDVEWTTLVFFMMLFIIIDASVETGFISMIASWVKDLSGSSLTIAIILILWVSAVASAFIDNIPFTATMLPVVGYLSQTIPHAGNTLWWALSLGACLGGNGTLIGASANVVTAGIMEKAGYPVTFKRFLKVGAPATFVSIVISMIWLFIGG